MARIHGFAPSARIIAHRGASGDAPENTVPAVRLARAQHADAVENDIQRTRDGALVVLHDRSLDRTTDVALRFPDRAPWHVADFTLAEVQSLDAGSWFDTRFAGAQVPTLAEWALAVGDRTEMLLEVKRPGLYPGIATDLAAELAAVTSLRRAVSQQRVVVQSFNHDWLARLKELAPGVPVGLLFGSMPTGAQVRAAATWADQVNPALKVSTRRLVRAAHDLDLRVNVWTVNAPDAMRRALRIGADGIITNHPHLLATVGARRGLGAAAG